MATSIAPSAVDCVKQSLAALCVENDHFASLVASVFSDVDQLQSQLIQLQKQFASQQKQFEEQRRLVEEQQNHQSTSQQADEALQSRVTELVQERSALEQELESVRTRAVEMAQTIADQKRQINEEHTQWAAELRQMRRAMEKQTARAARAPSENNHDSSAATDSPPPRGKRRKSSPSRASQNADSDVDTNDPVLDDVLSQFELLQRDVARRRAKTTDESKTEGDPEPAAE